MKNRNSIFITIVLVIVVGAVAFFGGMQFQKITAKSQAGAQFGAGYTRGGMMGRQFGQRGANGGAVIGEILSSDNNSITVKLKDGSSKIVILSNSTSVNKQATGSKSDLKTGENVAVFGTTNSDGSVTAQSVQLNPTFGSGMHGAITPTPTKE